MNPFSTIYHYAETISLMNKLRAESMKDDTRDLSSGKSESTLKSEKVKTILPPD